MAYIFSSYDRGAIPKQKGIVFNKDTLNYNHYYRVINDAEYFNSSRKKSFYTTELRDYIINKHVIEHGFSFRGKRARLKRIRFIVEKMYKKDMCSFCGETYYGRSNSREQRDIIDKSIKILRLTNGNLYVCNKCEKERQLILCDVCKVYHEGNQITFLDKEIELEMGSNKYNVKKSCKKCNDEIDTCKECGKVIHMAYARHTTDETGEQILVCNSCYESKRPLRIGDILDRDPKNKVFKKFIEENGLKFDWIKTARPFGLEIETSMVSKLPYYKDYNMFSIVEDGSIKGAEFISPPLIADTGIDYLQAFLKGLKAKVDIACGLHVHISATDLNWFDVFKVHNLYAYLGSYIVRCNKPSRINNRYCVFNKVLPAPINKQDFCSSYYDYNYSSMKKRDGDIKGSKYNNARYVLCNLHRVFNKTCKERTIEIRSHEGTLDFDEIRFWVKLNLILVEYAVQNNYNKIVKEVSSIKDMDTFWSLLNGIVGKELTDFYKEKHRKDYSLNSTTEHMKIVSSKELVICSFRDRLKAISDDLKRNKPNNKIDLIKIEKIIKGAN